MYTYTLPKVWQARIQKYWDKIMPSPSTYPASNSKFSLKFETAEETEAVSEFENQLGSDESVVTELLPEGMFASNYLGTYDVVAPAGEKTLLSPEKVSTEDVLVLHYANEEWTAVEDVEVEDGFVWGTLPSFSPVAVFELKKDIHIESSVNGIPGIGSFIVCEGNPVKVYAEDDKTYVMNLNTGKATEITAKSYLIGGSVDGSPIESTDITITGLKTNAIINKVISGSAYVPEDPEDLSFATVGTINVSGDTVVGCLTGSFGAVRTNKVNYKLKNAILAWLGCGESYAKVNPQIPDLSNRAWAKDVYYNFDNVKCQLAFLGQNCEYFYVENTEAVVVGGDFDYLISGGSNSRTNTTKLSVKDARIGIYQTTNRGNVADATTTFENCTVENLFVGGDATDSTVTGTTGTLKYEINGAGGSYVIKNGTENGHFLTQEDIDHIVKYIKVSRSTADITIDEELLAMLGDKYIVK